MAIRDTKALLAYVSGRQAMPFAYGANDCVVFAAGAAAATTGRDLLAELNLKPHWKDRAEAARAIKRAGGLEAALDRILPRVAPAQAQRGDIGLARTETGLAVVVVLGDHAIGPGDVRAARVMLAAVETAWSIG